MLRHYMGSFFIITIISYVELLVEIRDKMNWYTSKVGGFATPDRAEVKEWHIEEDYNIQGIDYL